MAGPPKLCSLSKKIYTVLGSCTSPACYRAEIVLSSRESFPLYFCPDHMMKAFAVGQLEADCRHEAQALRVISVSFKEIGPSQKQRRDKARDKANKAAKSNDKSDAASA
jgi:hypothetical protein